MLKKQSKKLTLGLVFTLIASLFMSVGSVSAANTQVQIGRVVTISTDVPAYTQDTLAPVYIIEDKDAPDTFLAGDYFYVALPSGIEFQPNPFQYVLLQTYDDNTKVWDTATATDLTVSLSTPNLMYIKINNTYNTLRQRILIDTQIEVNGYGEDTIELKIQEVQGNIPSGSWLIGRTTHGGTFADAATKPIVGESKQTLGLLRITEVGTQTFADGDQIILTLPQNIEWTDRAGSDVLQVVPRGGFSPGTNITIDKDYNSNPRKALITIVDAGGARQTPGILEITTTVNVKTKANFGDIEVAIEGKGNNSGRITNESVVIGTFADYIISLSATDDAILVSGQIKQQAGILTIREGVANTIAPNRNIEITLPKGVKFADIANGVGADVKTKKGSVIIGTPDIDYDRIVIPITNVSSANATTIEVNFKKLNIAPDFVGDIVVSVAGRAGVSGEVCIGTVEQALTAKESKEPVKIGFQNQKINNFVLTEAQKGAVKEGEISIVAPHGIVFAGKPIVEVTEGNLEIKSNSVRLDNKTGAIVFDVDSESTRASVITISDIAITVDRTVPVGPITFDVHGSFEESVSESAVSGAKHDSPNFDYTLVSSFIGANCVTPSSTTTAAVSQFVIGSTIYTINNEEAYLPVAPYIKDNRTYLPVRYVAQAMGVAPENILWNNETRTVTLLKGGVVVQLAIQSKVMLINGATISLDVAPEISQNYTMLPIALVAQAFEHTALWDAETQTVTISPKEGNQNVAY